MSPTNFLQHFFNIPRGCFAAVCLVEPDLLFAAELLLNQSAEFVTGDKDIDPLTLLVQHFRRAALVGFDRLALFVGKDRAQGKSMARVSGSFDFKLSGLRGSCR